MAYQVQRKNHIQETLELLDMDGKVRHVLTVDLNVDQIANRVGKAFEDIGRLQNDLQKSPTDPAMQEAYGRAVLATIEVIFGEEQTKTILDYYEDSYNEMLLDLFPFINDYVMPQIREASARRKEQLAAAAKASNHRTHLTDLLRRRSEHL